MPKSPLTKATARKAKALAGFHTALEDLETVENDLLDYSSDLEVQIDALSVEQIKAEQEFRATSNVRSKLADLIGA